MERRPRSVLTGQIVKQLVNEFIDGPAQTKDDLMKHLEYTDLRIADMVDSNPFFAANRHQAFYSRLQLATPKVYKSQKLSIPKGNSLTDSLLKMTIGSEDKLAKQYDNICRKNGNQGVRQASVGDVKKKFAQSHTFHDISANTKAFFSPKNNKPKPLIDNQHEEYMKTQLMFLQKPKKLNEALTYHTKKLKNVANKIDQLGGIEDTVKNMQQSLKCYQIDEMKKNQTYDINLGESQVSFNYSRTNPSTVVFDKINQSRQMRSTFQDSYRKFRT